MPGPKPKKPPLTHFLCIPLVTASSAPQWQASLDRFRLDATGGSASVLPSATTLTSASTPSVSDGSTGQPAASSGPNDSRPSTAPKRPAGNALPEKAIRPLHSLHLTLGVMSLREKEKLEEAKKLLGELNVGEMLKGKTTATGPLTLTLQSLHPMQSPKSTSVLYTAPHDPTNRLLRFCQSLRAAFIEKDLILDADRDLKLHATIVNTLHAKPKGGKFAKKVRNLPKGWGRPERRGESENEKAAAAQTEDGEDEKAAAEKAGNGEGESEEGGGEGRGLAMDAQGKVDGRWLVEKWKGEVFAEVTVEKIAICEMGAKADESGVVRYKEIAEVALPG